MSALHTLTELMGIKMEAVMTFGDGDNDAEMLADAGLGIAVANASERAKASARLTIASNEQDGVAKFLKQLMKAETYREYD